MQKNDLNTGLPYLACRQCGERVRMDPDATDDRCDNCRRKGEQADEVRYIISILEKGVAAAQKGDRSGLLCALRDARHAAQDMEKAVW